MPQLYILFNIIFHNLFTKHFSETSKCTSLITIRAETDNEEKIAVRRKFIHPWYYQGGATYYNDIAVLELGNRNGQTARTRGSKFNLIFLTCKFF